LLGSCNRGGRISFKKYGFPRALGIHSVFFYQLKLFSLSGKLSWVKLLAKTIVCHRAIPHALRQQFFVRGVISDEEHRIMVINI
jgi:hypothetical protein